MNGNEYITGKELKDLLKKTKTNSYFTAVLRFDLGRVRIEFIERDMGHSSETIHVLDAKQSIDQIGVWCAMYQDNRSHLSFVIESLKNSDELRFNVVKNSAQNYEGEITSKWLELRLDIRRRNKAGALTNMKDVFIDQQHYSSGDGGFSKLR